jgi:hypothetical protein
MQAKLSFLLLLFIYAPCALSYEFTYYLFDSAGIRDNTVIQILKKEGLSEVQWHNDKLDKAGKYTYILGCGGSMEEAGKPLVFLPKCHSFTHSDGKESEYNLSFDMLNKNDKYDVTCFMHLEKGLICGLNKFDHPLDAGYKTIEECKIVDNVCTLKDISIRWVNNLKIAVISTNIFNEISAGTGLRSNVFTQVYKYIDGQLDTMVFAKNGSVNTLMTADKNYSYFAGLKNQDVFIGNFFRR